MARVVSAVRPGADEERDGEIPPAEDLVRRWLRDEVRSGVDEMTIPYPDPGVGGEEGFEDAGDEQADAEGIAEDRGEEDEDAGDAFGGEAEGGAEEHDGREAAAGGADELTIAVFGGELGGGAEAGEDGVDGRADLDGVADVRGDLAEDVFALGEGDGRELGAEVGEVGFGWLRGEGLGGLLGEGHFAFSAVGWVRTGWRRLSTPRAKSVQAAAMRRRRWRPASVSE